MKHRKYECIESEGRYLLKIECNIPFHADAGGSRNVATKTRENATRLASFFFELDYTLEENNQSLWPWEIHFEEEYAYREWKKAMSSGKTARESKSGKTRFIRVRNRRKS
jgi:hypothetical protein